MKPEEQIEILNNATNKALQEVRNKRKSNKIDFIAEFYEWVRIVKRLIKGALH
ncbi:MAG: hypothetical protein O3A39_06810 [Proteobacteria bacterium]|nr:hypothetical protein [Pseudomonadota bacterium]